MPRSRRHVFTLLPTLRVAGVGLLCLTAAVRGQDAPLTTAAEIKALGTARAEELRRPVVVRAFNIGPSRFQPQSSLQQDGVTLLVVFEKVSDLPAPNTEVEVTGFTRGLKLNGQPDEPWIEAKSVRVLANGVTPPPVKTTVEDVAAARHFRKWVEVEGTVLQVRRHLRDTLFVLMAGDSGWMLFFIRDAPAPELPLDWLNARVRVRGVNQPADTNGMTLMTYGLMNVTVLNPGRTDPFQSPELKAADLVKSANGSSARVRFTATVLHPGPDRKPWLRDPHGTPFIADFLFPWKTDPSAPLVSTLALPIPVLHAGDVVELAGSPLADSRGLRMRYCEMRILRSGENTEPRPVECAALATAAHYHDLVTLKGRATQQGQVSLEPGRQLESVRLTSGGAEVEVYLESPDGGQLTRFSPDDLIEATGLVIPVPGSTAPAGKLMLRSAADIHSLGTAREVVQMRQWRNLSLIGGGVLLAAGVIFMLRRRLIKERAHAGEVRQLNATLEFRVAERTAELEHAREELKAALKEEREVGELKSRFVSTVSHEFRTPLGVIMSATDILESYMDKLTPERKQEHLSEIRHATRHMSGMMEDVLLLGRAEAGRLHLTCFPADLLDLSQRIANETHSAASQTGQTVITSDELPPAALVDEMLFRHMLSNLLSNAIKYSPPGATVHLHLSREGSDALITVTDQGIGIPPEDAAKLFQPFARAGNVGARSGTGLGLVVVKRCAELHGGNVRFTGIPGEGTTFTLRLPVFQNLAS